MRSKNEDGSKSRQEKGHVRIQDISFRYTATPYTADDRYKYRVYLRAIDPAGNSPIKKVPAAGEVRAAGSSKYISKEFYVKEKDARKLLSIIKYEAQQLYNDNLNYFIDRLQLHSFSATSPVAFFNAYGKAFLIRLNIQSPTVMKQYYSQLRDMCSHLEFKPMREFTKKDIAGLYSKIQVKDKRRHLILLKKFWDFYYESAHSEFANPVEEFLRELPGKRRKSPKELGAKASQILRLTAAQEKQVLSLVEGSLDEDVAPVILLMNGAGLPMGEILKLRWKNIVVSEDCSSVTVMLTINKSGATRDRRRPMFSAEAALMVKLRERRTASSGGADISELPLIEMPTGPEARSRKRKAITQAVRELLISFLGASALAPSRFLDPNIGTAASLLLSNYETKLLLCGAEGDSGLLDYLLCRKISSTTADHYRSFSSSSGQRYIQCILDRYESLSALQLKCLRLRRHRTRTEKGMQIYHVKKTGLGYYGQFQGSIFLKKGEQLLIRSGKGASVNISPAEPDTV